MLEEVGMVGRDVRGCRREYWWGRSGDLMKVVSYNVRGLGGVKKKAEVHRIVQEKHMFVLCLQESKLSVVDVFLIKYLWGSAPCGFSYQPSVGASGGLVTVWDKTLVDVWYSMSFLQVLVIKGRVILTQQDFFIFNLYAPCDSAEKQMLWPRLSDLVSNNGDVSCCVCRDFNSVHAANERRGRNTVFNQVDADNFNNFIDVCSLIDLSIFGRLFTWYHGDGISMSRLDHFLLFEKWCEVWPNCVQVAHQRGLSNHVQLVLNTEDVNWGLRPLRMMKCLADYPGYDAFVHDKLNLFRLEGWGGYVLQQKLKMIKSCLKQWHQQHFKNLDGRMVDVKNRISSLDLRRTSYMLLRSRSFTIYLQTYTFWLGFKQV